MKSLGQIMLILCFFCGGEVLAVSSRASLQVRHHQPTIIERGSIFSLTFNVPGINPANVQEAFVFYRVNGDVAFKQKKASLYASDFIVSMSVDERHAAIFEYYFEIHLNNGKKVRYPQGYGSQQSLSVSVVDQRKSEREQRIEETGVNYTILSPTPEATVVPGDVTIALALFYNPAEIDTANTSFQLLIDGRDVTHQSYASDYFYTFATDDLKGGGHTATFKIVKPDTALTVTQWRFSVFEPSAAEPATPITYQSWMPQGRLELSAQNQQIGGYTNDVLSGNIRLSGQKGKVSYSAYGLLTSQEDLRLQPQNRYGLRLDIGNWLELDAGHIYPTLNTLTISGQRVQGVSAALHLWRHALNIKFIYGKMRRGISNIYQFIEPEYQMFNGIAVDTTYNLNIDNSGTFKRNITGLRLGAGRGNNFEFGLNLLKVEDDTNSIDIINDYNSLMKINPRLAANLSSFEKRDLAENSGQLNISGNPTPRGNFIASSDLAFSFDRNRIQFRADGALSFLNNDISSGILTQEDAENLGITLPEGAENLLSRLSWLIILNENMNALFFRFDENANAELTFPTGIIATQSELGFNYLNNNLRVQYRWIGPYFNSLANSTVRKDIAGFSITDRIRLFGDRIYLTAGYEQLHDNLINQKEATTNTITYRGNLSWYPIDFDLPRISVGLMSRIRDNSVAVFNPYLEDPASAVQNFILENGDVTPAPNARYSQALQFTGSITQQFELFNAAHNLSLNYSILNTDDRRFAYGDIQSSNFSVWLINQFSNIPLQTNFGFNMNNTQTANGLNDISITGFNIGASLFLLDNRWTIEGDFAITSSRSATIPLGVNNNQTAETYDDYFEADSRATVVSETNAFIMSAASRYRFDNHHALALNFRYSNVQNVLTSAIIPNDHLLRLQYIFDF